MAHGPYRSITDVSRITSALSDDHETRQGLTLRERKKAKTRAALIEISQRLFAERGYTGTTLEDISAEVDITTQTLLRYFDSKAQLALAPLTAPLEELERFLAVEDRSIDTLTAWRIYVRLEAEEAANPSETTMATYVANLRAYREWVDKDPALVASLSGVERWLQEVLATAMNEGMRTLKQDGIEKVLQGITDIHQVRAVCIK